MSHILVDLSAGLNCHQCKDANEDPRFVYSDIEHFDNDIAEQQYRNKVPNGHFEHFLMEMKL